MSNSVINGIVKEINQGIPTFNNRRGLFSRERLSSFRQNVVDFLHIIDSVQRTAIIFPSGTLANVQFLSGAIN